MPGLADGTISFSQANAVLPFNNTLGLITLTGAQFRTLHLMFEEQYNELWMAVDAIAERIRTLGYPAPGTYREFAALTSIADIEGVPAAEDMVGLLVEGHEAVCRTARALLAPTTKGEDESTADLVTQRLQIHEKTAWMLRSLMDE